MNCNPISTSDATLAWTAFATSAGVFGAPVPTALRKILPDRGSLPDSVERVRHLIAVAHAEAAGDADPDAFSTIGVQTRDELVALASSEISPCLLCRVRFGTGRTSVVMDIWSADGDQPAIYWLWAEGQMDGPCMEPSACVSLANSLERRWQTIRTAIPEPVVEVGPDGLTPMLKVEVYRRTRRDADLGDDW